MKRYWKFIMLPLMIATLLSLMGCSPDTLPNGSLNNSNNANAASENSQEQQVNDASAAQQGAAADNEPCYDSSNLQIVCP